MQHCNIIFLEYIFLEIFTKEQLNNTAKYLKALIVQKDIRHALV